MTVSRVFGRCGDTDILTQGDLQHHRWLLESIDGVRLDAAVADSMIPELDFGERMTVSGNTGCNRFRGRAVLREQFLVIESMASTRRLCTPVQNEVERILVEALGNESLVRINAERQLILRSGRTVLRFRLFDWRP